MTTTVPAVLCGLLSGGDVLAQSQDVTVAAVTTLTAASVGKWHRVAAPGFDAGFTVTLPACASISTGDIIGIRVAVGLADRVYTIAAHAGDFIGPSDTYIKLFTGDVLLLIRESSGRWRILSQRRRAICVEMTANDSQAITAYTTHWVFGDTINNAHGAWASDTFTAPESGVYSINLQGWSNASVVGGFMVYLRKNGVDSFSGSLSSASGAAASALNVTMTLAQGDTLKIRSTQNMTRIGSANYEYLTITKIGD